MAPLSLRQVGEVLALVGRDDELLVRVRARARLGLGLGLDGEEGLPPELGLRLGLESGLDGEGADRPS